MDPTAFAISLYLAQACLALVLGVVLLRFYRSDADPFLLHWSFSWWALAAFQVTAMPEVFAANDLANQHPLHLIGSAVAFTAGYFQVLWLGAGTYELLWRRSFSMRTVWLSLSTLAASSVVYVLATSRLELPELRVFLRVGLHDLAAGLAFVAASYVLMGIAASQKDAFGCRLAAIAFGLYGLSQLVFFGAFLGMLLKALPIQVLIGSALPIYTNVYELLLQSLMGLGLVIWLLEEQQQRFRETEGRLHQSQQLAALGRLAGGIAHDFNNLLTVILGYSDMLESRAQTRAPVRKIAGEIKRAAERAAGLTTQLVAFSRKQVLEPKVIDLNEMVSSLESMLRRLIGEDIEVITNFHSGQARVLVDQGQIEQVIVNLVLNARDAMPHGGTLSIETTDASWGDDLAREELEPDDYAVLTVKDTGVGMARDTLDQAFEPFFTTKERTKGTGLGLSTVYGIVRQSGGAIRAQSEPGRGTVVQVYLPRAEGSPEQPERPVASVPGGTETILVAEDEDSVREMVAETLRGRGYEVLAASSGRDALTAARAHETIDLLVTDLIMPGMNGAELAEQLQIDRPDVEVLYMSGYLDDDLLHRDLSPGRNFLAKPFTPAQLEARVHEILHGARAEEEVESVPAGQDAPRMW